MHSGSSLQPSQGTYRLWGPEGREHERAAWVLGHPASVPLLGRLLGAASHSPPLSPAHPHPFCLFVSDGVSSSDDLSSSYPVSLSSLTFCLRVSGSRISCLSQSLPHSFSLRHPHLAYHFLSQSFLFLSKSFSGTHGVLVFNSPSPFLSLSPSLSLLPYNLFLFLSVALHDRCFLLSRIPLLTFSLPCSPSFSFLSVGPSLPLPAAHAPVSPPNPS